MNDLQQISLCLKQVTNRSLLLIDEFGKGTIENGLSLFALYFPSHLLAGWRLTPSSFGIDGIGLACGILEHLLNLTETPKVIAATHFHEIFENGFLAPRPRLQLGHMEVRVSEESRDVEDQITYLYKSEHPASFFLTKCMERIRLIRALQQLPVRSKWQKFRNNVRTDCIYPFFFSYWPPSDIHTWWSCAAMNGINQTIVTRGENLIAACATLSAEETKALEEAVWNHPQFEATMIFISDWFLCKQDALARRFLEVDMSDDNRINPGSILESLFEGPGE